MRRRSSPIGTHCGWNRSHSDAYLWLVNLGIALDHLERYHEAREAYVAALSLRPDDAEAYINLGVNYAWTEQHEEAISAYQKALLLDPINPVIHFNMANRLREAGRDEEAIGAYKGAIRIGSTSCQTYYLLGKMMALRRRISAARLWWKRGIAQPRDETTLWAREEFRYSRKNSVSRRSRSRTGGKGHA